MASRPTRLPLAFSVLHEPIQLGLEELPVSDERLCTCGHNIWDHEDAEGGTHECNFSGCGCVQFADAGLGCSTYQIGTKDDHCLRCGETAFSHANAHDAAHGEVQTKEKS